jgi:hypothetical protein
VGRITSNQRSPLAPIQVALVVISAILVGCARPQATAGTIQVSVNVDGAERQVDVPSGSSVQQVLQAAGVQLNSLDQVNPPSYTTVTEGTSISITRVTETFEIEQIVIPFERQTVRNETIPEGETRLLQPGQNGMQEITYRILLEAGVEISRAPVKNTILTEPVPEIVMIGAQSARTPLQIEGTLAYLNNGNAWVIQGTSGNRRPVVTTGDLDGRILRISPDGRWLLFTRLHQEAEQDINSLWVASLQDPELDLIDLGIANVVHFADWMPANPSRTIYFSTVEPSPSAPGWQANNDLQSISITDVGRVLRPQVILESNAGGQYGWWGTNFTWGNDANHLAYVRSDEIGIVDLDQGELRPLRSIIPFQTLSDWAWVPGASWGKDDQTLYYIDHGSPLGFEDPQASPVFNLAAINGFLELDVLLSERTGLFAYPNVSPILEGSSAEIAYRVAFLQAITPLKSVDSSYRLGVMDRDGSNLRILFPAEGEPGLAPETPAWSPDGERIAVLYRGDLWVVDVDTGLGQPLTSDGQTQSFDWGR